MGRWYVLWGSQAYRILRRKKNFNQAQSLPWAHLSRVTIIQAFAFQVSTPPLFKGRPNGVGASARVVPSSSEIERNFCFRYQFHYQKDLGSHLIFMTRGKLCCHSVSSPEK